METCVLVIKAKYGDFLRRFNVTVRGDKLGLSMGKLREKICSLFNLATDTELTLTYIDEDGETVRLVDDDDLRDVVKQALDPLRITVTMNEEKNSSSSTPLSSPTVQQQFQNINSLVSEILKTIPDPLHEKFAKLSNDLVSKLSSSSTAGIAPDTAEIVEYFSNVGLCCLSQISELQASVRPSSQNGVPERRETVTETKDSDLSKVDPTPLKAQSQGGSEKQLPQNRENSPKLKSVAIMKIHEVNVSASEGNTEASSSKTPGIKAVARPIEDVNKNLCDSEPVLPKSRVVPDNVGEKETANVVGEGCNANDKCYLTSADLQLFSMHGLGESFCASLNDPFVANNVSTGEKVNKVSGPHLGPNPAFAGAHAGMKGDFLAGWTRHDSPCDLGKSPHIVPYPPQAANDLSARHPSHWPSTWLHDIHAQGQYSLNSQVHQGMEVNLGVSKLSSCFIADVTMIDGTIITPLTPFTKIWRMRNDGTLAWPKNTKLVWDGGHKLSNSPSVELQIPAAGLAVNQELDVAVAFVSPELPGRYLSYWRMAAPSGLTFGQRIWVHIQVPANTEEAQHGVRGLNLNLPPVNNALTGPKANNAVMDPLVKNSHPEHVSEPITPVPNIEQNMKFPPISNGSMVGSCATNMAPTAPSSTVNQFVDRSDAASAVYPPPYMHYPAPPPQANFYPTPRLLYAQRAAVLYPIQTPPPSQLYPPSPYFYTPQPASLYDYTSPPPPSSYSWSPPTGYTPEETEELQEMEEYEEELLRELEELGFYEVEVNREILRFHEYDLEKTLIDLRGGNTLHV